MLSGFMGSAITVFSIMAALIFIYLVLSNGKNATSVLSALSSANVANIKALQGR